MHATAVPRRRPRFPAIWFAGSTLFWLLMSTYHYLDEVARQTGTPFYYAFIDELTGVYGAAALFPGVRWMVRRFPLGRRTWLANLARHAGALILFSLVHTTWNWGSRIAIFRLLGLGEYDYGLMSVRYWMEFPIDVILYSLFAWGVWLFDRLAAEREAALHAARLESELRQAQLQGLRLQLQPHFLFNALNTISSTMYDDPAAADTMLAGLAELLRLSLRTTQRQEVALATELEVLNHYVALLKARFGDRLAFGIDVDPPARAALVPSLILQPLVENAVRHGNLTRLGVARIDVRARRVGDRLRVEVDDDGPGPEPGVDVMTKGIGLSGTAARLRLLYGDAQRLHLLAAEPPALTGFRVLIELPFRALEASDEDSGGGADSDADSDRASGHGSGIETGALPEAERPSSDGARPEREARREVPV